MRTRTVKNPQTAYSGEMLDSLIGMVARIDTPISRPMPQHTQMPTEVEDFIEAERNGRDGRAA